MLVITTYFPLIEGYTRFNISNNTYWSFIWLASLFMVVPHVFDDRFLLYVIFFELIFVFVLLNSLWLEVDLWNKQQVKKELFDIIIPISIFTYFRFTNDFSGLAILIKFSLVLIFITALLSIYSAFAEPLYARLMFQAAYTPEQVKLFSKLGGGGYGFAHALVCLFPMVVYFYRNSELAPYSKKIIFIFGLICFIALIKMQIFANIILSIFTFIFSLAGSKRIKKSLILFAFLLLCITSIPNTIYAEILSKVSVYFDPESEVFFKLNDMSKFIEVGDKVVSTGIGYRANRYALLWDSFISSPFLGVFYYNVPYYQEGAHLYWFNRLTVYGFLGIFPFILIFYFYVNKIIKLFDQEFIFYFLLSLFSGLGYGLMKNITERPFWYMIFLILPGIYYLHLVTTKQSFALQKKIN